ncbi:MAG: hypothetical protein MJ016_02245 [Victivallaceae bacterium]|nr:hypothetical protein [Victivallaceae bacterium]
MDKMTFLRRHWIIVKSAIPNSADRCDFLDQVFAYAFDGKEPIFLYEHERAIFDDMREALDLSVKRRTAQQNGLQSRLQNRLQSGLQKQLQNGTFVNAFVKSKEKERKTPLIPPDPPIDSHKGKEREIHSAPASAGTRICAAPDFFRLIPEELKTPNFIVKWKEWEIFRREKRKPISDRAAKMQLSKLADCGVAAAIEAIDEAIRNDYQGLFPAKHQKPNSTPVEAPVYTQNERGAK